MLVRLQELAHLIDVVQMAKAGWSEGFVRLIRILYRSLRVMIYIVMHWDCKVFLTYSLD